MQQVKYNWLFDATYKLAQSSPYGRFRVGAIVARKNKIVGMGVNQRKTHPIQKRFTNKPWLTPFLHAETHAISLCRVGDLADSDIYVSRALADGSWANSRPCSGCLEALKHFGIKGMYYHQDGFFCYEQVTQ